MQDTKTHQQLNIYKSYNHSTTAGVLTVVGFLMLFGISTFPKNLLTSLVFFGFAYMSYKVLRTTKPIIISDKSISLGKMVNGYKETNMGSESIKKIELVSETKTEFRPARTHDGGDIELFSNYYRFILMDESEIRFDNVYDDQLKTDIKSWCQNNDIDLNLEIKEVIN